MKKRERKYHRQKKFGFGILPQIKNSKPYLYVGASSITKKYVEDLIYQLGQAKRVNEWKEF